MDNAEDMMLDVLQAIEVFHEETYGCCMRDLHSTCLYLILSYLWDIMVSLATTGHMTAEQSEWFQLVKEKL